MPNPVAEKLRGKSVVVFDWDGTLFDSMGAKAESFSEVVSVYLSSLGAEILPEKVGDLYRKYSGNPRREILAHCAESVGLDLSGQDMDAISGILFESNKKLLAREGLFPDAERTLIWLITHGFRIAISSSVPQAELEYFTGKLLPYSIRAELALVLGSQGSLRKGPEHIDVIALTLDSVKEEIVVVGDDEADFLLSQSAGVSCLLVDRSKNTKSVTGLTKIKSLDEIWKTQASHALDH